MDLLDLDGLLICSVVMFGKDAQLCLDEVTCYCETYGYCDMTPEDLQKQWVWRGITLPPSWPEGEESTG